MAESSKENAAVLDEEGKLPRDTWWGRRWAFPTNYCGCREWNVWASLAKGQSPRKAAPGGPDAGKGKGWMEAAGGGGQPAAETSDED